MNNVRYANDTVLIADSQEKVQNILEEVKEASEARGLNTCGKNENIDDKQKGTGPKI